MAKKYFQRALSVGLSLALCAGMVAPGFAATFTDLQNAIDSGNSVYKDGYSDEKQGNTDEETYKIKVEAGKDDEGNNTRVVTLYEDVENAREAQYSERDALDSLTKDSQEYGAWYNQESEKVKNAQESGIVIREGTNVTLDLNGHDINMNPGWELIDDGCRETEPGTFQDQSGHQVGNGGYNAPNGDVILNKGDVITVEKNAKLTLEDSQGSWTEPTSTPDSSPAPTSTSSSEPVKPAVDVPEYHGGKITGADGYDASGVHNKGTLVMKGGMVSGNGGSPWKGAVYNEGGSFTLEDGAVSGNRGGVSNTGTFTMTGGMISNNRGDMGAVFNSYDRIKGQFTMYDGIISGNTSSGYDGGVMGGSVVDPDGTTIYGGTFSGNRTYKWSNGHETYSGIGAALGNIGTIELPAGQSVSPNSDGSVHFPAGTRIEQDNAEYVGVNNIHVDKYGNMTGQFVSKTENSDKSVTITGTNGTQNKITDTNGGEVTLNNDGTTTLSNGGKVAKGNTETTYLDKTTINADGTVSTDGETVKKTENSDKSVTITDTKGGNHEITDTNNGKVTVDKDGNTTVPEGGKITDKDGNETTYPDGTTIDKDGNITGEGGSVTKTDNGDGTTTIKTDNGKDGEENKTTETKVDVPDGKDVTVDDKGTTTVPEGGKITDENGNETTYPDGTTIDKDGNVNGEKDDNTTDPSVTKDKNGDVTINDGKGNETKVDVPDGTNPDDVKVDEKGTTAVPGGTTVTGKDKDGNDTTTELPNGGAIDKDGNVTGDPAITKTDKDDDTTDVTVTDGEGGKTEINVPTDKKDDVKVNEDGTIDVPAGGKVTDNEGKEVDLPFGGKVNPDGTVTPNPDPNAGSQGGGTGVTGGTGEADVVVIDGVEVPLSGLVSVEDVLSVLYRLAEGVDGGRDEVVAWAVANGIIDDEADVEEIVTVAALRAILANYARAFELDVDVNALTTLTGEDDDIVMNCDEVIDEFFTKSEEDEAA